jgi:uncharacterized protein YcgI (DUF1989 family)
MNAAAGETLAPRGHCARELESGERLRITVVDGSQVPDIVLFAGASIEERLSPTVSQLLNGSFVMRTGHILYSNRANPLARIVEQTVAVGVITGGSCSAPLNYARFGVRDTPNCRTNLLEAGSAWGVEEADVQHIFCPFMTIRQIPGGDYAIDLPECEPGDYIELEAMSDMLALISNCPQERTPTNAYNPTRLHVWAGADGDARPALADILDEGVRA